MMKNILTREFVLRNLSICGSVILMFTYSILLDRDFACTCKPQEGECGLYMALPVFVIFVLVVWTDKPLGRLCRYWCTSLCGSRCSDYRTQCNCCSSLCCFSFLHFVEAFCIGALWVVFVLLDGDWYVCCESSQTEQTAHLACKDKTKLTEEERISIAELKSWSRVIGSSLVLGIVCLTFIVSKFRCRKCCGKTSSCCDGKDFYYNLILEEEEKSLEETFRKTAKEKLTAEIEQKIKESQWAECFDAAEILINNLRTGATSDPGSGGQNHGPSDKTASLEMENMDSETTPLIGGQKRH
uniref:uncharacterized protein LOC109968623 isoform X2 n=1 Tax=Monopterus albus TaxID=43700 RepID=UPI0009B45F9A|nr:uncharacterized protein LOC109968623 isoform X2 [Monopterus albus]